jgi:uncharacterized surface protein with fasciclin (FAS1) repeats
MRKNALFNLLTITILIVLGCEPERVKLYERPDWLAGKLFTQIQDQPELSTFAKCISRVGYDSVINISGSYTVFAPDNNAFDVYFGAHPEFNSIEDIPIKELERMVKYHIVQNPWSTIQLRSLDVFGWIDSLDLNNDEPRGFKRETLLRESNRKYGVKSSPDPRMPMDPPRYIIVDTLQSGWYRRQTTDARKFAPIFYDEYFAIYDLNSDDYAFYFGRPFETGNIYFQGAKIIIKDIFAENGFIHVLDKVVEPPRNAFQIMNDSETNSYKAFLDLVNSFPVFTYNRELTLDQPGASQGYEVDSLFDITYPDLTFSIVNEKTTAPSGSSGLPSNVTIRYHHGLVAPTDEAVQDFVSDYLTGPNRWGSLAQAPVHIRKQLVNTHMASGPIYPSNINRGFYNGENDFITVDQNTIVQKEIGSNCTFLGVNEVIMPRAFSSVTAPVYLLRSYSRVMYAIERSGLLTALKRQNNNYMFFIEADANLSADSALIYKPLEERFEVWQVADGTPPRLRSVTTSDLRNLLLNHIGVEQPTGLPRKEFIKTLGGNFLIVNNETGEVRGSDVTRFGYKNSQVVVVQPTLINMNADNGKTYDISNWFNFLTGNLYSLISANNPAFHNLLVQAGLANTGEFRYTFLSDDENYTVFVPSEEALAAYPVASLTLGDLRKFLMMHFVQSALIFTDGKVSSGYYETARIDEKSTQYTKVFTKIYIQPGIDEISFRDKDGINYLTVTESSVTNRTAARTLGPSDVTYPTIVTNSIVHEIDKVFDFNEMDTE